MRQRVTRANLGEEPMDHRRNLRVEVRDETFDGVVDVESVKPLNHIWGDAFVTEMKRTRFKKA